MRQFFAKLHLKLGDFWWYSLMLFCANRAADGLNVFVGLWLVPKYVNPSELGAVMPLMTFATTLALPVSIFAMTFMKEITYLANNREYGKLKSLMRGVFIVTAIGIILAIIVARITLPHFLVRMRVAKGSLGFAILAAAFITATAPIYSNALQGLKKFKSLSAINILGAPIRLVTMLIAMPIRPLSGYFAGQSSTPAFSIIASVFALHKELSVPAEPYWTKPVFMRFSSLFFKIGLMMSISIPLGLFEQTIIRQRLPELDSAAYYIVTRLSEIALFLSTVLTTTLFPYTANNATYGKSTRPLMLKATAAMVLFGGLLIIIFLFSGRFLMSLLPNGEQYAQYDWAIPPLILVTVLNAIQIFHTNTEISANRFGFLRWYIPYHIIATILILAITGYGYFSAYLPASWIRFLATHNISTLKAMIAWLVAQAIVRTIFVARDLILQKGCSNVN